MVGGGKSPKTNRNNQYRATRQRGIALIVILVLLGLLAGVLAVGFTDDLARQNKKEQQTADALAKAKEALIGYAANDPNQPGVLPCPDRDNDGSADSPCGATGVTAIGRLPWKTLGLPDLRDGSGECLWYAVSANFKNSGISAPAVVNSDSLGTLVVNDAGGTPVYSGSNKVVAIVFSPGNPLPGQDRPSSTPAPVCGGNTIAANTIVANYLEGGNQNGAATNIFVTAQSTDAFNDKLLPITREALFPVVEMRVARELRLSLRNYYAANGFFPLAAQFPNNTGTIGTYRGYVPTTGCVPGVPDLPTYLPAWFVANNWHQLMVYAVAPRCTPKINTGLISIALLAPPPVCATGCINLVLVQICLFPQSVDTSVLNCNNTAAGPYLTVSGVGGIESIVLPASYRLGGQSRPCNAVTDCLESVAGNNENIDSDNFVYVKPVRSSTNNDSLVIVSP
jgi:type II secretory pathway pseudopilin PulG